MYDSAGLEINTSTYDWCVKAFSVLQKRLGLRIEFHREDGQAEAGQIFLFNHFARFETLIPPYLIHAETGAYCRCVAARELFAANNAFTRFLLGVGVVPNDFAGLLPFLAAEILRGRKVIVFPEGGMVKDRQSIDDEGRYGVYSSTAGARRKHHAGAAVIALFLEIFKSRIRSVEKSGNQPRLERWVKSLTMDSKEALLEAAHKPTLIVPANITFYPIRVSDNILRRGAEFFIKDLHHQFSEELLIEGNMLLKNTDMDIRFGAPIAPKKFERWWEAKSVDALFEGVDSLDDLFSIQRGSGRWIERFISVLLKRETDRLRDIYMREIYDEVTVNLAHLASSLILAFVDAGRTEISRNEFHRALYLAIKYIQPEPSIHLHRFLANPQAYEGVDSGVGQGLDEFWASVVASGLAKTGPDGYRFLEKLTEEHHFDHVRVENPVLVYANEIAPLAGAGQAINRALRNAPDTDGKELAHCRFDDELRRQAWCREAYRRPGHAKINDMETATRANEPYLLLPEGANGIGVVLTHGFLASPAEQREFGELLAAAGFSVIGVRLEGHGTSPWDLRDRSWEDWYESVRRSYRILSAYVDRICLVGFATGGSLALRLAAEQPDKLIGVASISAPIKFRNRNLIFVPLLHGVNTIARWVPSLEGVMPFRLNDSEQPDINYRNIPIRGLHELRQTVNALTTALPMVRVPALVVQGTEDPIVDPKSADDIMKNLGSTSKTLHMVESRRHGILNENVGGCQEIVLTFIESLGVSMKKGPSG